MDFNHVTSGTYLPDSEKNGVGGNDFIYMPSNLAELQQAGLMQSEINGGAGDDGIVGRGLDDILFGGAGND